MAEAIPQAGLRPQKADTVSRIIALLIDGVIAAIASFILAMIFGFLYLGFIGPAVATVFILIRDTLLDGQSPGKKVMNLKAVNWKTGASLTMEESARRNMPMAAGWAATTLGALPIPYLATILGILGSLAALGLGLYDIWIWYNDLNANGRRWGDQLGDTVVVPLTPSAAEVETEEVVP
jgi:uncharacterized RDD family membrane protein YckC